MMLDITPHTLMSQTDGFIAMIRYSAGLPVHHWNRRLCFFIKNSNEALTTLSQVAVQSYTSYI